MRYVYSPWIAKSGMESKHYHSVIPNIPSTEESNFLSFDGTETYLIPLCSWGQAWQSPAIRSRISQPVVDESAIEFWDPQGTSAKKLDFASTRIWTHPVVEFASGQHPVHPMNPVLNFRSQNGHVNVVRYGWKFMFVYLIVRLILKWNRFFDYITSKKLSHRTQPEDAGCAEMQITQTDFFCWWSCNTITFLLSL